VLLDCNSEGFRGRNGMLPGARRISDFAEYDIERELPRERTTPLVFYCIAPS
jgi:hypothetical protein